MHKSRFGHTSQNQVLAVPVYSRHGTADAQARITWELKCKKIHVTVLVLVYSSQKRWSSLCTGPVFGHTSQNHV